MICFVTYFFVSFLFERIFYQGKIDKENRFVANLSPFAETILFAIYFLVGVYQVFVLSSNSLVWYEWIFPVVWIIWFLTKGFKVILCRNNFIKIKDGIFEYYTTSRGGIFSAESYQFADHLLVLRSIHETVPPLILDLKEMNLRGYTRSLKKYLKDSSGINEYSFEG
jgi:hypothetical protein